MFFFPCILREAFLSVPTAADLLANMTLTDKLTIQGLTFEPFVTQEQIAVLVHKIARQISAEYNGKTPHFIIVLNGAVFFATDLLREISIPCSISFVRLRSYQGTSSTGKVEELLPLDTDITDKDVIVIEDLIDTGVTMHYFKQQLAVMQPRSIAIASLLFKPTQLLFEDAKPDYYGQEIPKEFIIGYGMDLDGLARNLPQIYKLCK